MIYLCKGHGETKDQADCDQCHSLFHNYAQDI